MNDLETEGLSYLAAMEDQSLYNKIIEHGGRLFYGAPCMIVVPIDPEQYAPALIDCGILCQNITLAATSLGIANIMCGFTGLPAGPARPSSANVWGSLMIMYLDVPCCWDTPIQRWLLIVLIRVKSVLLNTNLNYNCVENRRKYRLLLTCPIGRI